MREDGYPWLHYEVSDRPNEGDLQSGSYDEDHLPGIIGQCLWMWQGTFYWYKSGHSDIINIPHAFCRLTEGIILTNACTGKKYEIIKVLAQKRDEVYSKPPIEGVAESIKIPPNRWYDGFHPGEVTGGLVQIKPLDGEGIDLDKTKGHFLSLPADKRPFCRIIYSKLPDEGEGKGVENRKAGHENGYEIEMVLTKSGPNQGRQHFGDTKNLKPRRYTGKRNNNEIGDPTLNNEVWSQTSDTYIEFNLKAPSAVETGMLVRWFKIFMWRYNSVIRRIGFTDINFDARFGGDIAPLRKVDAGDMAKLRYVFRWEFLLPSQRTKFRNFDLTTEYKRDEEVIGEEINPKVE
jgi:hypothetical protein